VEGFTSVKFLKKYYDMKVPQIVCSIYLISESL